THPRIAPGLEQPWKPGSPDGAERLLCTLQTIRYRCDVTIQPSDPPTGPGPGGYLVQVVVYKELEDLKQPIPATGGGAAIRSDNPVERQYEVVDPSVVESNWIPLGREVNIEQILLQRITKKLHGRNPNGPS